VRESQDKAGLTELLQRCAASRVEVVFKRLETPQHLAALRELSAAAGVSLLVQGYLLDEPRAALLQEPARQAA
jgi:EAL domain-containing protein (putative c-di-GMP-specific phosphodiesterase class I)